MRAAEDRELAKTFTPDISASMKVVQPLEDKEPKHSSLHDADGAPSSTQLSDKPRFDRLYADAARRDDTKRAQLRAQEAEFKFQPEISESQRAKTGGVGGTQRFDALFEEAMQRDAKLRSKQANEAKEFQENRFTGSLASHKITEALVEAAVQKGKLNPDPIARLYQVNNDRLRVALDRLGDFTCLLYLRLRTFSRVFMPRTHRPLSRMHLSFFPQDASSTQAKELAQLQKQVNLAAEQCPFQPKLYDDAARPTYKAKSAKQKKLDAEADAAKARYVLVYVWMHVFFKDMYTNAAHAPLAFLSLFTRSQLDAFSHVFQVRQALRRLDGESSAQGSQDARAFSGRSGAMPLQAEPQQNQQQRWSFFSCYCGCRVASVAEALAEERPVAEQGGGSRGRTGESSRLWSA